MADKAHTLTDEKLAEMEKRLSAIYYRAQKEVEKTSDEYFDRFTELDAKKRQLLDEGKITEKEYKDWRKNKIMYGKHFDVLKKQIAEQLLHVNETATAYINEQLPEVYALNYNSLAPEVDGLGGYSFELTDADTVKDLATTDTSLLPYKELNPAKDIPWNMKKINAEILQGIIQGDSVPKLAKRMLNVEEMNKNAAIRTARTIVTGAENKGRQDSYERAQKDGIELKRRWIATHDKRTRDWHTELNGVVVGINEPWTNAVGEIMFPGDPSADGANVYNCRCTMAAKVMGFKKEREEKTTIDDIGDEIDVYKYFNDPEYAKKWDAKEAKRKEAEKFGQFGILEEKYPKNLRLTKKESAFMESLSKQFDGSGNMPFSWLDYTVRAYQGNISQAEILEYVEEKSRKLEKAESMIKQRKEEGYKGRSKKESFEMYKALREELKGADEFERGEVLESFTVGESGIRYWQIQRKQLKEELEKLELAEKIIKRKKFSGGK